MRTTKKHYIGILGSFFVFSLMYPSCKKAAVPQPGGGGDKGNTGMVEMTPYEIPRPVRFPEIEPIPEDNKMYVERVELGKKLFYDSRLSNNGESCNSCHLQEQGFASDGTSAFDKGLTSLPLVNLAWNKNFMWASRIQGSLEDVMLAEITKRFNTDIAKINDITEYRDMFSKYYGTDVITAEYLAKPLAQFLRTIVSKNTKFDRYLLGWEVLTPQEERGRAIFFTEKGDCFHCHVILITTDNSLRNNGLDAVYEKEIDKGHYIESGDPADLGKFRTPNLRNIALKNNFMHDGRFKTLTEVIQFYNNDVNKVDNIDPVMLKPGKEGGLQLTEYDIADLVAFLNTFTDYDMINDPSLRKPE